MQTKIFGQIIAIGSKGMACAKPYWFGQALVIMGLMIMFADNIWTCLDCLSDDLTCLGVDGGC